MPPQGGFYSQTEIMMKVFPTLYKKDVKGKVRVWHMETDGARFRTVAGLQDGEKVTSEWKVTHAKNVGRANATTDVEQAEAEVLALYKKRLEREYHEQLADINEVRFFKPMLASKWEDFMKKPKFPIYFQPKLDGIRCIANRDGVFSREGKQFVSVPHVEAALKPFFDANPDAVLDGELYNHDLKDDFNEIVSIVKKTKPSAADILKSESMAQYHVYDFPSVDGSFTDRYDAIDAVQCDYVKKVYTVECQNEFDCDLAYNQALEDGYEGGIYRVDAEYQQKRSKFLIKRKEFEDQEFRIVRVEEGQGNWSGYAKRVIFENDDGREVGAGLKGNQAYCRQVLQDAHQYVGGQVTVQFFTRTPDGVPRFPIAKALFKGKRDV
jgi:DNA ligase 1